MGKFDLSGVHHDVTYHPDRQRVRLEQGSGMGQSVRAIFKTGLPSAVSRDEKKKRCYGCFYSHDYIRKYIKIYY